MQTYQIQHLDKNEVIFTEEGSDFADVVKQAYEQGVNLKRADLRATDVCELPVSLKELQSCY